MELNYDSIFHGIDEWDVMSKEKLEITNNVKRH